MNSNLKYYIVSEETSIIETMKKINAGDNAIAFVCRKGHLVAAVSDGDVRRFIISGGDVERPVSEVANYSPISVLYNEEVDYDALMREKAINALPIVDENGSILDIRFLSKRFVIKKKLTLPVVIMAGGKGTRLKPFTEILPKPLIPIGNKTITEHIISRFKEYGCEHFDMIINYKKNFIKSYFQDNDNPYDICFIEEPEFWGTAGGLKLIENKYGSTFFVTNCDILIQADYEDIVSKHKESGNILTVVCAKKKVTIPYGTIETDESTGTVKAIREKPTFEFNTNTGLYLVEPELIKKIPGETKTDITDVIEQCIKDGDKVGTYLVNEENWLDMGQLEEMERMKRRLNVEG
ncbi:MAG: NTP transferase domain-containing protein [Lachnospiraceae bacterium]|nr:NTP transferase domain-containing protein [Lachnospiraceae bacterium]